MKRISVYMGLVREVAVGKSGNCKDVTIRLGSALRRGYIRGLENTDRSLNRRV